jgi:hypothetical protein
VYFYQKQEKGFSAKTQKIPSPGFTAADQYVIPAFPFSHFARSILSRIEVICTYLSSKKRVKLVIFFMFSSEKRVL